MRNGLAGEIFRGAPVSPREVEIRKLNHGGSRPGTELQHLLEGLQSVLVRAGRAERHPSKIVSSGGCRIAFDGKICKRERLGGLAVDHQKTTPFEQRAFIFWGAFENLVERLITERAPGRIEVGGR